MNEFLNKNVIISHHILEYCKLLKIYFSDGFVLIGPSDNEPLENFKGFKADYKSLIPIKDIKKIVILEDEKEKNTETEKE